MAADHSRLFKYDLGVRTSEITGQTNLTGSGAVVQVMGQRGLGLLADSQLFFVHMPLAEV
jgi:hypothetical protein